ncbi:MAG: hypothetical protein IJ071_07585 [Ruminococcus sp.]|nr:hypothetical protein [Ruminococcus sp.]
MRCKNLRGALRYRQPAYKVGQNKEIMISPEDPTVFYVADDRANAVFTIIFG